MYDPISISYGRTSECFARRVFDALKEKCDKKRVKVFFIESSCHAYSNGNIEVNYKNSVRETDCFIFQSGERSCLPTDPEYASMIISRDFLELCSLVRAATDSARRVSAVTPYFFYARSDKKNKPRICIGAKLMGDLLETSGASRILTMDLHAMQTQGNTRVPIDQIFARNKFVKYFLESRIDFSKVTVLAPDKNSADNCEKFIRRLEKGYEKKSGEKIHIPLSIVDKRRPDDSEKPIIKSILGTENIPGRIIIIPDDEILGSGTLMLVVKAISRLKPLEIHSAITHGVLSGKAVENVINSPLKSLLITDTVELLSPPEKIKIISVADDFAELIKRVHTGRSVSEMDIFE